MMFKQIALAVFIMVIFTDIILKFPKNNSLEEYNYMNDYLYFQSIAFSKRSREFYFDNISFNEMGNVNRGKTIFINGKEIVVRIGNGSIKKK